MDAMRQYPALRRSLLMGTAAAIPYGGWAAIANAAHGAALAGRAALAQCFISFSLTFFMTVVIERLHGLGRGPIGRVTAAVLGGVSTSGLLSFALHTAAGTPERLRTLLPPLSIGAVYALLYALRLERGRRAEVEPPRGAAR